MILIINSVTLVNAQGVKFGRDTFDFGQVIYNSDPKRYLEIFNNTDDTLYISHINMASCCDLAYTKGTTFYPHSNGFIEYEFDTKLVRKFKNTVTVFFEGQQQPVTSYVKWEVLAKDSLPKIDWSKNKYPKTYVNPATIKIKFSFINLKVPDSLKTNTDFYVQLINPDQTYTFKKTGPQRMNFITVDTNTVLRVHYKDRNIDVSNFRQYCSLDKSQLLSLNISPSEANSCFWVSYSLTGQFIFAAKSKAPCNICLDQFYPCDYYYCSDCMHIDIVPEIQFNFGK